MRQRYMCGITLLACLGAGLRAQSSATPPGGTVRALAADPFHPQAVLLGTTTGVVFRSADAGARWEFWGRVAAHDDWVVSSLIADPAHAGRWYAGLWSWAQPDGGVYASSDDGRAWQPLLAGHAVRQLAVAASDPNVLVAATLDGVYRSRDAGAHWALISPAHDRELSDIESVAIDPTNPEEIYVGTWHLPWKTVNGGHDWWQMRQGVIDDSDVFSITVDRAHPQTVYLSACSGIYRSDDRGNLFRKIQGIPYSARRTPALVEDPAHPGTIYAGTTQGLWVARDGGATWQRITAPELRINAVLLSGDRVLLGTDFAGVWANDGPGQPFQPANQGFSSRQVSSVAPSPGGRFVAVTGDGAWGGVFFQDAATAAWRQLAALPGDRDVYALHWSPSGLLAATAQGVWVYAAAAPRWRAVPTGPAGAAFAFASPPGEPRLVFAAARAGLYRSRDGGLHWTWMRAAPAPLYRLLALAPQADGADATPWLLVAGAGYVLRSPDAGAHFVAGRLSLDANGPPARINQLAAADLGNGERLLLAATSRGLFISRDAGATWSLGGHGLPATDVRAVETQPDGLYALAATIGEDFRSRDAGFSWRAVALPPAAETLSRTAPSLLLSPPAPNLASASGNPGALPPRIPERNRNRPK